MKIFHPDLLKLVSQNDKYYCPFCSDNLVIERSGGTRSYEDWFCLRSGNHFFKIYESTGSLTYNYYIFSFVFKSCQVIFNFEQQTLVIKHKSYSGEIYNFDFSSFQNLLETIETYLLFA